MVGLTPAVTPISAIGAPPFAGATMWKAWMYLSFHAWSKPRDSPELRKSVMTAVPIEWPKRRTFLRSFISYTSSISFLSLGPYSVFM